MSELPKVLVVDDSAANLLVMNELLRNLGTEVFEADSGEKAIAFTLREQFAVILLDVNMPGMDGFETAELIRSNSETKCTPIIFVTGNDYGEDLVFKGYDTGAVDFLFKPFKAHILRSKVNVFLQLQRQKQELDNYQQHLEKLVSMRTGELATAKTQIKDGFLEVVFRLALAAEFKDEDTGAHIVRIGHYARIIARKLGLDSDTFERLFHAAPLHDIGKIGIPDRILLKPGKLEPEEHRAMRNHTVYGAQILRDSNSLVIKMACEIARTHHEKWDGSGYPHGLVGHQIPLSGRIVAVADVFDALVSKRCYKEAMLFDTAVTMIQDGAGTHFDPKIVKAFMSSIPDLSSIFEEFSNLDKDTSFNRFRAILLGPVSDKVLV